jgi:hypothetical protein
MNVEERNWAGVFQGNVGVFVWGVPPYRTKKTVGKPSDWSGLKPSISKEEDRVVIDVAAL